MRSGCAGGHGWQVPASPYQAAGVRSGGGGDSPLDLSLLLTEMRKLKAMRGVGPSGWRNEYLRALAIEHADSSAARVVSSVLRFAKDMANNRLPGWFYRATAAVRLVVLVKRPSLTPGVLPDLRPIGVGDNFMRVVTRAVVKKMQPTIRRAMWPQQVGVGSKGAAGLLAHWAALSLQLDDKRSLVKIDFANAFNAIDRGAVLRAVKRHPTLGGLYPMACAWSRSTDVLLGPGLRPARFKSRSGQTQGYPPAGLFFAIALHPHVQWLDGVLWDICQGEVRFYLDDGHIIADLSDRRVYDAVMVFRERVKADLGLELNIAKFEAFSPNPGCASSNPGGNSNPGANSNPGCSSNSAASSNPGVGSRDKRWDGPVRNATEVVDGEEQPGCKVMGVPLGCEAYVRRHLDARTAKCVSRINKVTALLHQRSTMALWCATWYCNTTLLHHWLQLCPPRMTAPFAADIDIALRAAAMASVVALHSADDLDWRRFRQPCSLRGAGFRSCEDARHAAWLGGVCATFPRFLPVMEDDVMGSGFSRVCAAPFPEDAFLCSGEGAGYGPLFGTVPYGTLGP